MNHMTILTPEQVLEIKQKLIDGVKIGIPNTQLHAEIAKDYPVLPPTIGSIHRNQCWKEVGPTVKYVPQNHYLTDVEIEEVVKRVLAGQPVETIGKEMGIPFSVAARNFKKATGISIREHKRGVLIE